MFFLLLRIIFDVVRVHCDRISVGCDACDCVDFVCLCELWKLVYFYFYFYDTVYNINIKDFDVFELFANTLFSVSVIWMVHFVVW